MFICTFMPIKILFSPCESDKLLSWLLKTQWQWSLMTNEQINSKSSFNLFRVDDAQIVSQL